MLAPANTFNAHTHVVPGITRVGARFPAEFNTMELYRPCCLRCSKLKEQLLACGLPQLQKCGYYTESGHDCNEVLASHACPMR